MGAHHVLGVLEDDDRRLWAAFSRAVELAEAERARLTLAKTTDPGRLMRWFAPGAALAAMSLSIEDLQGWRAADYALARVLEFVPPEIPVTTVLLGHDTAGSLLALLRRSPFDCVVLTDRLANCRGLRRTLPKLEVRTVLTSHQLTQPDRIGVLK